MDLKKYIDEWSNMKFDKNSRITLLVVYAVVMFFTIAKGINTVMFILLFVVAPIGIYLFVKQIFPKDKS